MATANMYTYYYNKRNGGSHAEANMAFFGSTASGHWRLETRRNGTTIVIRAHQMQDIPFGHLAYFFFNAFFMNGIMAIAFELVLCAPRDFMALTI